MAEVVEVSPADRFEGLDDEGRLEVEHRLRCSCGHGLRFPLAKLGERAQRWRERGREESDLETPDEMAFERAEAAALAAGGQRFAVELYCASCARPQVVIFERSMGDYGVERFSPRLVLERAG
jgi:hypothetical protein